MKMRDNQLNQCFISSVLTVSWWGGFWWMGACCDWCPAGCWFLVRLAALITPRPTVA